MNRLLAILITAALLVLVPQGRSRDPKTVDPSPEPPSPNRFYAFKTSLGTFEVELFEKKAPLTVKNFLGYVDRRFYDGTVFHRTIEKFVVQGGGYEKGLARAATRAEFQAREKKAGKPVKNESSNGLSNLRGTIALARAREPDSGTCQFYVNVKDNITLDHDQKTARAGYCVFGKVVTGMDVVDRIARVRTKSVAGIHENVPAEDVVILSIRPVSR